MPDTPQHKSEIYGTLNLYEIFLKLCFGVVNMRIVSTNVDNLYVHLGLKDALSEQIINIAPYLPSPLTPDVLPATVSGMTQAQYQKLQGGFGPLKLYADSVQAHSATIDPYIQGLINDAQVVLQGGSLATNILLSESTVGKFNFETKIITINEHPIKIDGAQEYYFVWAMFMHNCDTRVSWDELLDEITEEFNEEQVFDSGCDSMRQAMHRVNRKIKKEVGTADSLFSYKRKGFERHFGPDPE